MPEKRTISHTEPAERPISVALSQGEIYALILHHEKQMKQVSRDAIKVIGKHAKNKADIDAVRKEAVRLTNGHILRAKGLKSILESTFS